MLRLKNLGATPRRHYSPGSCIREFMQLLGQITNILKRMKTPLPSSLSLEVSSRPHTGAKRFSGTSLRIGLFGVFLCLAACQLSPDSPETLGATPVYFELDIELADYGSLDFFIARPLGFDAGEPTSILINFPVAGQTRRNALALINSPITLQATRRGYVVIVPYGPPRALTGRALDALPAFLRRLRDEFRVRGGKFDVMGASAGGITALELAVRVPGELRTIIAYPGYLPDPSPKELENLAKLCPQIYVGSHDRQFRRQLERNLRRFEQAGVLVHSEILDGVGHDFGSFEPERARWLLDRLETPRECSEVP